MRLRDLPSRIRAKIAADGPYFKGRRCWVWIGARSSKGYGSCRHQGSSRQAHIVVWEILTGRRLARMRVRRELDHLCRNRWCVNPHHLEPVSRGENNRRSTCWHHLVAP